MFAWGANRLGQLGNGATSYSPVSSPVKIAGLSQVTGISAGWDSSLATETSGITQISAGAGRMLALRSDGTVLGWGLNLRGQLGNGSQTQVSGPVQVTGLTNATQVAAGRLSSYAVHTVLGLVGQSS